AQAALFASPRGVAVDDNGRLFFSDTANRRVRMVMPDRPLYAIAGDGFPGLDDGRVNEPGGLFLDGAGNLYFADTANDRVRRLIPDGFEPELAPVLSPALVAVNAASFWQGPVAPGELLTLLGDGVALSSEVRFEGALV